ncbi:MAG: TIGR02270 family protein [Aquabacterium sp.]|nr:TIGR02270 family protein [Aquabacterium sp.]
MSSAPQAIFGFKPDELSGLLNRRVVEIHASEAAFLWLQRTRASMSPHFKLKHLAKLDARVMAHLAGLLVAGDFGIKVAQQGLEEGDPASVFVLSYLAVCHDKHATMAHVLQLAQGHGDLAHAVCDAMAWAAPAQRVLLARKLMASPVASHRCVGITALASNHEAGPQDLAVHLRDADPLVRGAALRASAGYALDWTAYRDDPDDACRLWAASAAVFQGQAQGGRVAWDIVCRSPDLARAAIRVVMRCGDDALARDMIRTLASLPEQRRLAVVACGEFGDPATVPWLLSLLDDPVLARVAGEALAMLSGADLIYLDLDRDPPDDAPDAHPQDGDLPWPDSQAIQLWWQLAQARFTSGHRYVGGHALSAAGTEMVLKDGFQRQRAGAAFEMARLVPGTRLFNVQARADVQAWRQVL